MDTDTILQKLEELNDEIRTGCELVSSSACGLDNRCGSVFICKDYVASNSQRLIEYYGGFEYIDKDDKCTIGDTTYYFSTSDRVQDCIDRWQSNNCE